VKNGEGRVFESSYFQVEPNLRKHEKKRIVDKVRILAGTVIYII
jgi:hypothetical protein